MEKMKFETPDMAQMNVEKIAALFPNCVTESRAKDGKLKKAVNFDVLKQMLGESVAEGDESYEFTWVGKRDAMVEAAKPIRKTLRPCVEESKNFDTTENLYIEGDNLEALKLLQEGYLGKVKMIYIDPPYNTGNDFIYKDDFRMDSAKYAEESGAVDDEGNRMVQNSDSNGRFHSDWCSMIYSRLLLARNLLTDDGVIVISIGYQENINLVQICKELFGNSQVINVTLQTSGGKPSGGFNYLHEYLIWIVPKDFSAYPVESWGGKSRTPFEGLTLSTFDKVQRPNQVYPIFVDKKTGLFAGVGKSLQEMIDSGEYVGEKIDFIYDYSVAPEGCAAVWPVTSKGKDCVWRQIPSRIKGDWEKGYIKISPNKNEANQNAYSIQYLPGGVIEKVENGSLTVIGHEEKAPTLIFGDNQTVGGQVPTIWTEKKYFTVNGTHALGELFPENAKVFDYPKPLDLLHDVIQACTSDGDIILDFFSGSASSSQSIMELNAADGLARKFIMVQYPEVCDEKSEAFRSGYKNICDIAIERIRRAGDKILAEQQAKERESKTDLFNSASDKSATAKPLDIGFRVLKIDDSNMKDVYYSAGEISQQDLVEQISNIKDGRTDMDLLFGCLVDWGVPLSLPIKTETIENLQVYNVNDGDLVACFANDIPEAAIRQIAAAKPLRAVFRDSSFKSDSAKINVTEIFKTISPNTTVKVV